MTREEAVNRLRAKKQGADFMGKFKDLTGQVFGRLTVLERDTTRKGKIRWICRCECGKIKSVRREHLTSGATKSCGCFSRETTKIVNTKHDLSRTKAYRTWLGMKSQSARNGKTTSRLSSLMSASLSISAKTAIRSTGLTTTAIMSRAMSVGQTRKRNSETRETMLSSNTKARK